jgi:hypothetical protein
VLFSAGGSLLLEKQPFSWSKGPFSLGTVSLVAVTVPSFSFIGPFFAVAWHPSSGRRPLFSSHEPSILAGESICLDLEPLFSKKAPFFVGRGSFSIVVGSLSLADLLFYLSSDVFFSAAIVRLMSASLFFLKEDRLLPSNDGRPTSEHARH